ncbi:MAG: hypothetical protein ACK5UP_06660, partial [Bacteroidota bacterium]
VTIIDGCFASTFGGLPARSRFGKSRHPSLASAATTARSGRLPAGRQGLFAHTPRPAAHSHATAGYPLPSLAEAPTRVAEITLNF